ncbi:MAG: EamA family transporter RarD [Salinispira sp.]
MSSVAFGSILAATAHIMWGLFPLFWKLLDHVDPMTILAYRIVFSFMFSWPIWFIIRKAESRMKLNNSPERTGGNRTAERITARVLLPSLIAAALISINWYTYIWSVVNGFILDASLGYFLTPLMNLLTGIILLGERPGIMRSISLSMGGVAILIFTFSQGRLPVISLTLALSFGLYGYIKKRVQTSSLLGIALEMFWLLVPALYILFAQGGIDLLIDGPRIQRFLLIMAGPVTLAPLLLFASAAKRIPMYSLGFFLYLTPVLTFALAWLVFGERKDPIEMLAFALVWIALILFSAGVLRERRRTGRVLP